MAGIISIEKVELIRSGLPELRGVDLVQTHEHPCVVFMGRRFLWSNDKYTRPDEVLVWLEVVSRWVIMSGEVVTAFGPDTQGSPFGLYTLGDATEVELRECVTEDTEECVSPPTILELLHNFEDAVFRWIGHGMPVVTRDVFDSRLMVCRECKLWEEKAYSGLGRCSHNKCGCTIIKHWLGTEKCPLDKW